MPETVRVLFGPHEDEISPLVGKTVGEAMRWLKDAEYFENLPADPVVVVNGDRADFDDYLDAGDILEIQKKSGEKGC